MKSKHIIHITPVYWDNWGYQENYISEYQANTNNKITIITPATSLSSYRRDLNGKTTEYFIKNVRVIRLKLKWKILNRFYWYDNLYKILIQESPDIIMIHGLAMIPVLEIIKFKKKNPNCTIYADFHSDYLISGTNFLSIKILHSIIWRYFVKLTIPYIEKIYYTRPSVKKFITDLYKINENILEELLMGSDSKSCTLLERESIKNVVREKLKIPLDSFVICTGGKINSERKLDIIINSLANFKNQQIHLIIFGKIDDEYLKTFQSMICDKKNIHFIGWLQSSEIYDYYFASNIAIFLGNHSVLWEQAIGCGTPTIFGYKEDREYLDTGENCIFLFKNNELELIQYLKLLINNPELILKMRKNAIEKGELKFSYENIVSNLNKSWGL
jgi:1,2-diacylglycerol 3-alpha-glucosyltransferase